eukprot:SAG31_NODE_1468_length_8223_cov_37.850320_4_plen_160_part_00
MLSIAIGVRPVIMSNAVAIGLVGYFMDKDLFLSQFTQFNTSEVTLFNVLAAVCGILGLVAVLGLVGAKIADRKLGSLLLSVYSLLLVVTLVVLGGIYLFVSGHSISSLHGPHHSHLSCLAPAFNLSLLSSCLTGSVLRMERPRAGGSRLGLDPKFDETG